MKQLISSVAVLALFFLLIEIADGVSAIDRSQAGNRPRGVEQVLDQRGLSGRAMSTKRDIPLRIG